MARHTGKNGVIKLASNAVVALTSFDIEETIGTQDLTAAGDTAETHGILFTSWSGTVSMNTDHAALGQDSRAGDSVAFEGYTEGTAVGKTFYSGTATIESMSISSPHDGKVTREYKLKGNGALASAVAV